MSARGVEGNMKVELIKYPSDEDWMLVKHCALVTEGKVPSSVPTQRWKEKILEARHSPIRELRFVFALEDIPYWVSVHLCRHVHTQPYVRSQRNDRQSEYDRNGARQDAPVTMLWSMNAEALITVANKRLCRKASTETQEVVRRMCDLVIAKCPEFEKELVPMCARNGGVCHEFKPCTE